MTNSNSQISIEKSNIWQPISISSNYFINPSFGAIKISLFPSSTIIISSIRNNKQGSNYNYLYGFISSDNKEYVCVNNNKTDLYTKGILSLQKEDGSSLEIEIPTLKNDILENFTTKPKSFNGFSVIVSGYISKESSNSEESFFCVQFYDIDLNNNNDKINIVKKEINSKNVNWRYLNLIKGNPLLLQVWCYNTSSRISFPLKTIKDKNGFSLVTLDENQNLFRILNLNSVYEIESLSIVRDNTTKTYPTGEEYLLITDNNYSSWNIPVSESIENCPPSNDISSLSRDFLENIDTLDEEIFELKVLNIENIITISRNSKNKTLIFNYSDLYPKFNVEYDTELKLGHNVSFVIGNPYEEDGIKKISINVSFEDSVFSDNENEFYDKNSYIRLKVSCSNENNESKDCVVFIFNKKDKTDQTSLLKIKFNKGDDVIEDENYLDTLINLPDLDLKGSKIIGYNYSNTRFNNYCSINTLEFKNKYKLTNNNEYLWGFPWSKAFNSSLIYCKEIVPFCISNGLPEKYNNSYYYYNDTNNSYAYYKGNDDFSLKKEVELDFVNENYYSIIKLDSDYNDCSSNLIAFGYNDDLSTKIKLLKPDFSEISEINYPEKSFYLPFGKAKLSKNEENVIKILVFKTIDNNVINYDLSYFDENVWRSSIGNICELKIDLNNSNIEENIVWKCEPDMSGSIKKCTIYFPKNLLPDKVFSYNKEKIFINELFNNVFIGNTYLFEFEKFKSDLKFLNNNFWVSDSVKIEVSWDTKNRSVSKKIIEDSVMYLYNRNNNITEYNFSNINRYHPHKLNKNGINGILMSGNNKENELLFFDVNTSSFLTTDQNAGETKNLKHISIFNYSYYTENHNNEYYNPEVIDNVVVSINELNEIIFRKASIDNNSIKSTLISTNIKQNIESPIVEQEITFCKHISIPGIHKEEVNTDIILTDDCILVSSIKNSYIITLKDGNSYRTNVPNVIDVSIINGTIYLLSHSISNEKLEIYNYGNLHPKY